MRHIFKDKGEFGKLDKENMESFEAIMDSQSNRIFDDYNKGSKEDKLKRFLEY
jgi:hypothetical protein